MRRASANVVSVVAKYAVPAGEWPDLLNFLFQCSQSAQEDHREVKFSVTCCAFDIDLMDVLFTWVNLILSFVGSIDPFQLFDRNDWEHF